MHMRKLAVGLLAVAGSLALAAPAYAGVQPWTPLDTAAGGVRAAAAHSQIVDAATVEATWRAEEAASALGTSIETADLGINVETGDVVSVGYELKDGASPAAGSVRLFIYNHADADTFSDAPTQSVAVPNDGPASGTLTITVSFTGTIGTAGLVYDTSNGGVEGTVRFSNLTVAGEKVAFKAEPEPTTEPSTEPSDTAPTSAPPAAGGLPVTGAPVAGLAIGGVLLLGTGAGLLLARRRRLKFTA